MISEDTVIMKVMQDRHCVNVGKISEMLSRQMGATEEKATMIGRAATLHDIGKEFVPAAILNKAGKLTAEEMLIVKTHAAYGFEYIIRIMQVLSYAAVIALQHHEHVDGSGYAGVTDIHPAAKLVAVADVLDALLSKRAYKEAWAVSEVIDYMNEGKWRQFEPQCVEALLQVLDEILALYDALPEGEAEEKDAKRQREALAAGD